MQELKEKYSIIVVTHNMQQAARISDKTAFFYQGYVVEHDDTKASFENPKDKRTEDYVSGRFGYMIYRAIIQADMDALHQDVMTLGKECYQRLDGSTEALTDADTERARVLVKGDSAINSMANDINTQAINLITTQQHVATDLRLI